MKRRFALPRWVGRHELLEGALYVVAIALAWLLGGLGQRAWLERAATVGSARLPSAAEVSALATRASLLFSLGVVLLALGRVLAVRRSKSAIAIPLLFPAVAFASLLGLIVHHASLEVFYRVVDGARVTLIAPPTAASFAEGFALGALLAALLVALPLDLVGWASRLRPLLALSLGGILVALALFGTGPVGSRARINLGPLQPIEGVKVLFVLFLATYFGARASKLRWQRSRLLGLRWPRTVLLVPAVGVLLGLFAGLYVIGDLGPVLILALTFVAMFYAVTRSSGWAALSIALVVGLLAAAFGWPSLIKLGRVATRIAMWRDPWWNGVAHGDQLGESLWALAAGGGWGQGLAQTSLPLVPAGKTDLVLATLVEQLGLMGLVAYLLALFALVGTGLFVAARARTPERILLASGAALLLLVQWAVIHAGTFGLLPLTGVVAPFLSAGRSSMVAFVVLVGWIGRVAAEGAPRAASSENEELHRGALWLALSAGLVALVGLAISVRATVVDREPTLAMGIATRLRDGTPIVRMNPRLLAMVARIPRGTIADRHGEPLAITDMQGGVPGARRYPLGTAMGTLLGSVSTKVLLPPWALERLFDERLRGYGSRDGGRSVRSWDDLRAFAALFVLPRDQRERRLAAIARDVGARSVQLSLDAKLQRTIAARLGRALAGVPDRAAAVAVIDVDTGQVLARVQAPDYDPNDAAWAEPLLEDDADAKARFTGTYGPWSDKTGVHGVFQSGSVGKLFTALAAARQGWQVDGRSCQAHAGATFQCVERDAQGPLFTRPGWPQPVHDHEGDRNHGQVGLVEALGVSCNVYFGQLGLAIGPEAFSALVDAGVDVGYGRAQPFEPGAAGSRQLASTAFGQGALAMNVVQAARLTAAIGAGGHYRSCPPTLELVPSCADTALFDDPSQTTPIVAGMRRVMTHGTGRRLRAPSGIRVYGKTGTADVRGFAGEEAFGIQPADPAPPHSWFVALAEAETSEPCQAIAPGRLAVAVVFPRGGLGAARAGPMALEIVAAAYELGYLGGR